MDANKIDEDFMGALLMRKLGMKSNMLLPVTFSLSFLATPTFVYSSTCNALGLIS